MLWKWVNNMNISSDVIKNIYDRMGDKLSRRIFTDRLMYSLLDDSLFLEDLVSTTQPGYDFLDKLKRLKKYNEEIIIYGAGVLGRSLYATYKKYIDFFVDKNSDSCNINGIDVLPLSALREHNNAYIIVALSHSFGETNHLELFNYLLSQGFKEEQIITEPYQYYQYFLERIYFDIPSLEWKENLTFLDIGSFDGANSVQFLNQYRNKVGRGTPKVVAVEPGSKYICKVEKIANGARLQGAEFDLVNYGVYDIAGKVKFNISPSGVIVKDTNGAFEIECKTIDDILNGSNVDLIKMDIEGCEYNAIKGAINTISKCKPQLAVSIYHKAEDIIELPELIMNMNLNYKFYLRHYSIGAGDTVLYAI